MYVCYGCEVIRGFRETRRVGLTDWTRRGDVEWCVYFWALADTESG